MNNACEPPGAWSAGVRCEFKNNPVCPQLAFEPPGAWNAVGRCEFKNNPICPPLACEPPGAWCAGGHCELSWRSGYPNRRPRSTVKQGCFYSTTISLVLRNWPSVCSDSRVSYEKIYGDSYFIRVVQDRLLNTKIYLNNSTNKDSKI